MFNEEGDMASLFSKFGKKGGVKQAPVLPAGGDLDLGMGMDMGIDLPSFDDLDNFAAKMKKEDEKPDFKPMLPKVRMRDPATTDHSNGRISLCLAPPPPPSAPMQQPKVLNGGQKEIEARKAFAHPFTDNMYPSVYDSLHFASADSNPYTNTMYPTVYAILRFKSVPQEDDDEFNDFEMAPAEPEEDDEDSVTVDSRDLGPQQPKRERTALDDLLDSGSEEEEDLQSLSVSPTLGKENYNSQCNNESFRLPAESVSADSGSKDDAAAAPAQMAEPVFADFAAFDTNFDPPEEKEEEELVLTDLNSGKRISLDDMNKQLEAEMQWAKQAMQQEQREDKSKTQQMGQTAAGAQEVADAIARSSGQGVQFRFDQSGAAGGMMPTGRAMNPKVGGGTAGSGIGWGRKSSDAVSTGSSRGSGFWG